jgi:hypothetical protein
VGALGLEDPRGSSYYVTCNRKSGAIVCFGDLEGDFRCQMAGFGWLVIIKNMSILVFLKKFVP